MTRTKKPTTSTATQDPSTQGERVQLVKLNDAASQLAVSRPTLMTIIEAGHLNPYKLPGINGWKLSQAEVHRYAEMAKQNKVKGGHPRPICLKSDGTMPK